MERITGHQSVRGSRGVIAVIAFGLGSPVRRGNGRWTFSSHASRSCSAGRAFQTNTAKPTACIVRWSLRLHDASFLVLTANDFWHLATAACRALTGYATTALQHYDVPQWGPFLVQRQRRFVVARENQRSHSRRWGIFGTFSRRPGTDQGFALSGSLHDLGRRCSRFLLRSTPSEVDQLRAGFKVT